MIQIQIRVEAILGIAIALVLDDGLGESSTAGVWRGHQVEHGQIWRTEDRGQNDVAGCQRRRNRDRGDVRSVREIAACNVGQARGANTSSKSLTPGSATQIE